MTTLAQPILTIQLTDRLVRLNLELMLVGTKRQDEINSIRNGRKFRIRITRVTRKCFVASLLENGKAKLPVWSYAVQPSDAYMSVIRQIEAELRNMTFARYCSSMLEDLEECQTCPDTVPQGQFQCVACQMVFSPCVEGVAI